MWLPQAQLQATEEEAASLTRFQSLDYFIRSEGYRVPRNEADSESLAKCNSGIQTGNHPILRVHLLAFLFFGIYSWF